MGLWQTGEQGRNSLGRVLFIWRCRFRSPTWDLRILKSLRTGTSGDFHTLRPFLDRWPDSLGWSGRRCPCLPSSTEDPGFPKFPTPRGLCARAWSWGTCSCVTTSLWESSSPHPLVCLASGSGGSWLRTTLDSRWISSLPFLIPGLLIDLLWIRCLFTFILSWGTC